MDAKQISDSLLDLSLHLRELLIYRIVENFQKYRDVIINVFESVHGFDNRRSIFHDELAKAKALVQVAVHMHFHGLSRQSVFCTSCVVLLLRVLHKSQIILELLERKITNSVRRIIRFDDLLVQDLEVVAVEVNVLMGCGLRRLYGCLEAVLPILDRPSLAFRFCFSCSSWLICFWSCSTSA